MHKCVYRIMAWTAAALIALSSVSVIAEPAGAEGSPTPSPAPSAKASGLSHYEGSSHHPGKGGKMLAGRHFIMKETAKLLDMECGALKESLDAGKTLPQIAKEKKGWSEEQYVQKLSEAAGRNVDRAVAEGRLDAAEAKKIKDKLPGLLKLKLAHMDKKHE